jgi:hypothetical protein
MFSLGIISNDYIVAWHIGSQYHDTLTAVACLENSEMKTPIEKSSFSLNQVCIADDVAALENGK